MKSGDYHTATQFYADMDKIWYNSYSYNEKSSKIYKATVEMERYYKKLLSDNGVNFSHKRQVNKAKSQIVHSMKEEPVAQSAKAELVQEENSGSKDYLV